MIIQLILLFLSSLLVFSFPLVNHPLMMGLIVLGLTIIISTSFSLLSMSTWLSYALVLILLGGLLVIFIYVSLLAPNENQETLNKKKISSLVIFSTIFVYFFSSDLFFWVSKKNSFDKFNLNDEGLTWLTLFYSENLGEVTIFLVLYLFLTLIVVVFISKTSSSALRAN